MRSTCDVAKVSLVTVWLVTEERIVGSLMLSLTSFDSGYGKLHTVTTAAAGCPNQSRALSVQLYSRDRAVRRAPRRGKTGPSSSHDVGATQRHNLQTHWPNQDVLRQCYEQPCKPTSTIR